jgi:hypothetical protein
MIENQHLKHIVDELESIGDGISAELKTLYPDVNDRIFSPLFTLGHRIKRLRSYVAKLRIEEPRQALVKPCLDCGEEEANPGLDVCGPCYNRRITGGD